MKDACIGILMGLSVSLAIIAVVFFFIFCSYFGSMKAITSTPVEEMYHRQLVVTIDSILNARFSAATFKELKDKDSAGIADYTHYEKYFIPME